MTATPIFLILFAGGVLIAAFYRITPRQAWGSLRGRVEALQQLQRRQGRRQALLRALPDFLGNLLVGYQMKGQLLEALESAVQMGRPRSQRPESGPGAGKGPAGDPLVEAIAGALKEGQLAESKYPPLQEAARALGDPLLVDLFLLLEEAEEGGGDIAAILESYLEHAYQRKATHLLEQAKVLPLKLLGVTVPLLLPTLIIVMVAPFLYGALQAWVGK